MPRAEHVLHPAPADPVPADMAVVAGRLTGAYPEARTELDHADVLELLIATVLSAQTTDVRVNALTPGLFARWPGAAGLAAADPDELAAHLRPLGMGATRARRLIGLAARLLADHAGEVPDDQAALEALPGVGRKTAHVVRGVGFGHPLLAVDTHVGRLSRRLGWTRAEDPRGVERDVLALADAARPSPDPRTLGLRLILHGRAVCTARAPRCRACPLADVCPRRGVAA